VHSVKQTYECVWMISICRIIIWRHIIQWSSQSRVTAASSRQITSSLHLTVTWMICLMDIRLAQPVGNIVSDADDIIYCELKSSAFNAVNFLLQELIPHSFCHYTLLRSTDCYVGIEPGLVMWHENIVLAVKQLLFFCRLFALYS